MHEGNRGMSGPVVLSVSFVAVDPKADLWLDGWTRGYPTVMFAARITLAPLVGLAADEVAEVCGRARKRCGAEVSEARFQLCDRRGPH